MTVWSDVRYIEAPMLCSKQCIASGTPLGAELLANYQNMKERTQKFSENLNGTPRRQNIFGTKNHSQTHTKNNPKISQTLFTHTLI